ncbi:DNA excision repair protein ERCC-4 [Nematocida homosporus]|uniref:DNA excision repair protein ERCC-4 n=1 Tax=Nematocida homosporus TaxID=1912981 RepID=UPI00221ECFEC|nr:DNA excision repair protein ERCC-4 [Nematocida homosporus]KAI5186948.1 DNA excision repair protein ERCC-4 [Nematocida homosporus]
MLAHERRIVHEVMHTSKSIHLLYQGIRLERIVCQILRSSWEHEQTLVIIGAPETFINRVIAKEAENPAAEIINTTNSPVELSSANQTIEISPTKTATKSTKQPAKKKPTNRVNTKSTQSNPNPTQSQLNTTLTNVKTKQRKLPNLKRTNKSRNLESGFNDRKRARMYLEGGTLFTSEVGFLSDLLKGRVPEDKVRVVYLLGGGCLNSSRTNREFILFGMKSWFNVLMVYDEEYSFAEVVKQGGFSGPSIFLYPFFRRCVMKSFDDFDVTEIESPMDSGRLAMQTDILELSRKLEQLPEVTKYDRYIWRMKAHLKQAITYLFNTDIALFKAYFIRITSVEYSTEILENFYGASETPGECETKYRHLLTWLMHDSIEEITQIAEHLAQEETQPPKLRLLKDLLKAKPEATISVLGYNLFDMPFTGLDTPIHHSSYLISEINRIAFQPHPHLVLLNYNISLLRRIKLLRKKWIKTGANIEIVIISIKDSAENLFILEEIKNEKDRFISAIGLKKNRPAHIVHEPFMVTSNNPAAPSLSIDVREMRSTLPLHLAKRFSGDLNFDFTFLLMGDYVLNGTYFIERKSIPDLISSFRTGRLFKQLEAIICAQEEAYLLIEFPENDKISLYAYVQSRQLDIDLIYRLTSLLRSLKQVHLYFSNSNSLSAALIKYLSRKPASALSTPAASSHGHLECLLSLPGVDRSNIHLLFQNFNSLYDLIQADLFQLVLALGPDLGHQIFDFFNEPIQS